MKPEIHPEYIESTVTCACGNSFKTRSTKGDIHVEICSACHPFFTGKQKLIDSAGRVERYMKRYGGQTAESEEAKP
jgi:large subunit ribosomal protein L31